MLTWGLTTKQLAIVGATGGAIALAGTVYLVIGAPAPRDARAGADASASATPGSTISQSASATPTPSRSQEASPSPSETKPTTGAAPKTTAPAPPPAKTTPPPAKTTPPPAKTTPPPPPAPAQSAISNAEATMLQAGHTGTLPYSIDAEIALLPGATVRCWVEAAGQAFEADENVGEGWIGDRHPLSAFGDVVLEPADYPFSAHCTTSDGASWSTSGTALHDEFVGP